jgi:anti-anti-sigma regulatory factor
MPASAQRILNYSVDTHEGTRVLELAGILCAGSVMDFERIVNKITDKENLIVNLEKVRMVTAPGLYSLIDVSMTAKEKNKRVIIMKAGDDVDFLSEILDNYSLFISVNSYEEGQLKLEYFV